MFLATAEKDFFGETKVGQLCQKPPAENIFRFCELDRHHDLKPGQEVDPGVRGRKHFRLDFFYRRRLLLQIRCDSFKAFDQINIGKEGLLD